MKIVYPITPQQAVDHLKTDLWKGINTKHIRKIIAEFAHEGIITPELIASDSDWGHYRLQVPLKTDTVYFFYAKILALNHWSIKSDSIMKQEKGQQIPLDSLSFIVEFNREMGIDQEILPVYMEEISSTLSGSAYTHFKGKMSANELVEASYQEIEGAMTGHPRFAANNGRVGFDAADYQYYAPEAADPFALLWLAGHVSSGEFVGIEGLDYESVIKQELGDQLLHQFNEKLIDKGLDPKDYYFFPVHPWQWFNKLANIFSPAIATNRLLCLGYSEDRYLPQQSIRTFYNVSSPTKFYAKTALSILNMGYVRGLSPFFMRTNPGINQWIYELTMHDPYLTATGFCILREVASVSYMHDYFEGALTIDSSYKKMLACLWRESPASVVKKGQQLMTMAALLHVDNDGKALLPALIKASGLSTDEWLDAYFKCYLSPLLHCFYKWDMVFMPHGENLILVLENHIPVRAIMKDIGEEVSLLNTKLNVPEVAERLKVHVTEENKTLPVFTQVFDSFFRFIAAMLVEHDAYPEHKFWRNVANCVHSYQNAHPEFEPSYEKYDFFTASFRSDALNRMQLRNNRQLRDRKDPYNGQTNVGMLINPIAQFKNNK
ncbi:MULTISPECIES: IucA/IucC family siderophore biosynthesis protein [unclassified Sphingobacterium]|uniref:IucA/IucC family protein n=1 Tax=unclassified Sphingobacterium TaxID=2609468 RepID=UPI00104AB467|nr:MULTISPECIES: IucA/IucC family siderophore biosynthesis protein [unclassified Sphingobacterium]MCS3556577.1 siderophore synthetase component [Sphingobacterium sp. JUb21]TCQ99871.1 siderophore synthetase component [Sphingobacterium sp. JUb20]